MTEPQAEEARRQVAYFMRRLYARGLTTTSGGNLSLRLEGDVVAITSSGTDKARLRAENVALVRMDGVNRTPGLKPSIETGMHLHLFRALPRVRAVVHAHPPCASVFTVIDRPLNVRLLAEAYALLGEPAVVPYALMGSDALAEGAARALAGRRCALLANHGVITVGEGLLEAYDRLEVLEQIARVQLLAESAGRPREISTSGCGAIDRLMQGRS